MFRRLLYLLKAVIPGSMKCCSPSSVSSSKPGLHPGTISSCGSDATVLYCVEQTWSIPSIRTSAFLSHTGWLESLTLLPTVMHHTRMLYGLALAFPHLRSPLCVAEWLDTSFCRRVKLAYSWQTLANMILQLTFQLYYKVPFTQQWKPNMHWN